MRGLFTNRGRKSWTLPPCNILPRSPLLNPRGRNFRGDHAASRLGTVVTRLETAANLLTPLPPTSETGTKHATTSTLIIYLSETRRFVKLVLLRHSTFSVLSPLRSQTAFLLAFLSLSLSCPPSTLFLCLFRKIRTRPLERASLISGLVKVPR